MGYLKILILSFFILNCNQTVSHQPLWEFQFWILYGKNMPRKVLWVEDAMQRWEIGMRWIPGENRSDSKHWLTVSQELKCTEVDVLYYKDKCEEAIRDTGINGLLLGLCLIENDRDRITESTIILNSSLFTAATRDASTDIISHEIGHCLGLKHSIIYNNLMFPFYHGQAGRQPQQSLLKKIYVEGNEISESEKNTYFQTTQSGKLLKHDDLPIRMININSFK